MPANELDDEISLVDLIQTIWDGRWVITLVTSVSVTVGALFAFLVPKSYEAQLDIKPIPTTLAQPYAELNSILRPIAGEPGKLEPFFRVDQGVLLGLFIEDLTLRRSLVEAIKKHGYITRASGETDQKFEERVLTTAYDFELIPPTDKDDKRTKDRRTDWSISFKTQDPELAQVVLTTALGISNQSVQSLLKTRFEQQVAISSRANRYALEDLRLNLNNTIEDYDKQVRNRLAFLREQAAIARSLNIAKNTIEAQAFQGAASSVVNVKTESPFYLRGYEAIEKEIQLLGTRKGKKEYIDALIDIEKKTRDIEQSRLIDRAKVAFDNSPITKGPFQAAFFDIAATEFKSKTKTVMVMALALIAGLFVGVLVVFLRKALANARPQE
jgi:LPS O-antigen subunit length determinant protein (WzzB/FepE family)